ncbi:hypothetical protein EBZ38_08220 [bacterium]|nr:hypothetical protein [bacterium]
MYSEDEDPDTLTEGTFTDDTPETNLDCLNDSPITMSSYTPEDNVITIKFPDKYNKFDKGQCITKKELEDTLKSDRNSPFPSYIQCIYTPTNNTSGYGAKPTHKLVFKLPMNNVYITIGSLQKVLTKQESKWYALQMFGGRPRRIGNVHGAFGASMNHGQIPGFNVYKLFTKKDITSGRVIVTETLDDYFLFPEQLLLHPFTNGHSGVGGVNNFIHMVIDSLVDDDYLEILTKANVNYTNPNDFVYKMNGVSINNVKNEDGSYNFQSIAELYMKWYNHREINCADMSISSIPSYPNVINLVCAINNISVLGNYPKLKFLVCYENNLTTIPEYPFLEELHVAGNQIQSLPPLRYLKILFCNLNNLQSLPDMPQLQKLNCSKNQLTQLPVSLQSLMVLECQNNWLTSIPKYPRLVKLNCDDNLLSNLPRLDSLLNLSCRRNNIVDLPQLRLLQTLYCDNNSIQTISIYPRLIKLSCSQNKIRSIASLPQLLRLDCRGNPLLEIGEYRVLQCVDSDVNFPQFDRLPSCNAT